MDTEKLKKTRLETLKEQQAKLEASLNKNKAEQQKINRRQNEKEKKARTRRLIQIGAITEKYFGEFESIEEFENFLKTDGHLTKTFKEIDMTDIKESEKQ